MVLGHLRSNPRADHGRLLLLSSTLRHLHWLLTRTQTTQIIHNHHDFELCRDYPLVSNGPLLSNPVKLQPEPHPRVVH